MATRIDIDFGGGNDDPPDDPQGAFDFPEDDGNDDFNFGANVPEPFSGPSGIPPSPSGIAPGPQITPSAQAPANLPDLSADALPDPKKVERDYQRALRNVQRQNNAKLKQEQADQKRALQRQAQDQAALDREARQMAMEVSQRSITEARSAAVSERIQAYGMASALGFPGYVGASIADYFAIRPREEEESRKEKAYQWELKRYTEEKARFDREQQRLAEDAIRNRPVEAVDVDAFRLSQGLPPLPGSPGFVGPMPGGPPPPREGSPDFMGPPRPPAVPPVQPTGPTPPERPTPGPPGLNLGSTAHILTGVIQAGQQVNAAIDRLGKDISSDADDIFNGGPYKATRAIVNQARNSIDPLGVNIGAQIVVSGMDSLLSTTESILKSIERDAGFAPQTLMASVTGDIRLLMQQMQLAQEMDPTYAAMIELNTEFTLVWNEFKATIIQEMAPEIIQILKLMLLALQTLTMFMDKTTVAGAGTNILLQNMFPWAKAMAEILQLIAQNTEKERKDIDDVNLLGRINDFMNATNAENQFNKIVNPQP